MGFGVWGLGFGVLGSGFGVWGLGDGVWGLSCGVWGWELGVGGVSHLSIVDPSSPTTCCRVLAFGFHFEKLIVYKLGSMKFTA